MVTLRRYFNVAEAAVDKTRLDDRGIFCSIADENSYLYGGAGFAMSIRILVAEDQFEEATRVLAELGPPLADDFEPGAAAADPKAASLSEERGETLAADPPIEQGNPWEILAVAFLFFAPGLTLLLQRRVALLRTRGRFIAILSPANEHWFGALAVAIGLALIGLYFYTRRAIRAERDAFWRTKSQNRGLHLTPG